MIGIAGGIQHAAAAGEAQGGSDLGAEMPVAQAQVEDREVGPEADAEDDRFGHRACDAADLVAGFDQNCLQAVCDHEIIFNDQNLEHRLVPCAADFRHHPAGWDHACG